MIHRPPGQLELWFCPECGRTDRYRPFTGSGHFARGKRCSGKLVEAKYKLAEVKGKLVRK